MNGKVSHQLEEVNSGMSTIQLGTGCTGYNSLRWNKLRASSYITKSRLFRCTACPSKMQAASVQVCYIYPHPILKVLICKICVRRNFGLSMLARIEDADHWKCFICNEEPLGPLQEFCRNAMDNMKRNKESQ
jgi:hypothetical protein